jgi:AcrR family transcriptional regulator
MEQELRRQGSEADAETQYNTWVQDLVEVQDAVEVETQSHTHIDEIGALQNNAESQDLVMPAGQPEAQSTVVIQDQVISPEPTEPEERTEPQDKSESHDQIVLAALKLFAQKGFFNTSLTDIAKQAGLKNTNAVYPHFKNKQAIAAQLYANILDSLNISIDDIRRKNQKSSEQLRGIVDLLFKLTDDAPDVMRFLLILKHDEFLPEEKPLLETPAFVKIHKIIQAGIKAGEIRNIDPVLANAYFFGVINNTLRMILIGVLDKAVDAYQAQAWLAAWSVIARK